MRPGHVRVAALAIVAVPLVGYPVLVGVDGAAFPSPADCIRVAGPADEGELDLVFGRLDSPVEADRLLERVREVGYVDAVSLGDGCGRWKVIYDGIASYEQGLESRAEARGAGLDAELELEAPG